MAELDNVSKKVLDDARKEKDKILEEARGKARAIIEDAEKKAKDIHRSGKLEAWEKQKEVLNIELSRAKSGINQKMLMYKIGLVEDTIDRARQKLADPGRKDYEKFLKKTLGELDVDGGFYQIGSEEVNIDDKMIESIKSLKKVEGKPDFKKGIRIIKGKAEYNITPESFIDANIDDIRMDTALYLFGKEKQ
ncbi:MAG: V-type ATP synthase subunit E [Actinomycetota bacterium]|nr:V-type ATP synthase subunit E [Actinomycetota bacterium]